ncbi:glutathione S-transferase family protein [Gammaproteobacteria bacterium]|nr:glutathione S-transferase family protein [SAR86 cluster bacterium]MDB3975960.1 glutathione S-transferase family protein [Gammaproteobacteria bacterium]
MSDLTLYHNGPSTCSQKVRLILELKELEYKSKLIDLMSGEQHDPEYIKLNPNHVVPTLVVNDDALIESSLINEFLEDAYPEISTRPSDPKKLHQMRLWVKYIDSYHPQCGSITYGIGVRNILLQKSQEEIDHEVAKIPDLIKRRNRVDLLEKGLEAPIVIEGIQQSKIFLDRLENELQGHDWLYGESFGIADAATIPYIIRMDQLALSSLFNESSRPNICSWYRKIQKMDIFQKAVTQFIPQPLVTILNKFGEDQKDQVLTIMEND